MLTNLLPPQNITRHPKYKTKFSHRPQNTILYLKTCPNTLRFYLRNRGSWVRISLGALTESRFFVNNLLMDETLPPPTRQHPTNKTPPCQLTQTFYFERKITGRHAHRQISRAAPSTTRSPLLLVYYTICGENSLRCCRLPAGAWQVGCQPWPKRTRMAIIRLRSEQLCNHQDSAAPPAIRVEARLFLGIAYALAVRTLAPNLDMKPESALYLQVSSFAIGKFLQKNKNP